MIQCEAHVRMRLKAVFGRINKGQFDEVRVAATDEVSRDLEWFLLRYPMEVDNPTEIARRARSYDARSQRAAKIISGDYTLPVSRTMVLPPRAYQAQAAALVLSNQYLLLVDELGLGKSCTSLAVLTDPRALPAVVVCLASLPSQWQRECAKFWPDFRCVIAEKATPYELPEHDVLVISYAKMRTWAEHFAGHYKTVIFDEIQELRHGDSARYGACAEVASGAHFRVGLTATPIYNYGHEFYNVISALDPGVLGTKEEFIREWCGVTDSRGRARLTDPEAFGTYLRETGIMLRRTRKDVGRELPAVSRIIHEIECDSTVLDGVEDAAVELANIILTQNKGWDVLQASQKLSSTLRQATGVAKAPYVAQFVRMLLEDTRDQIVLFGWHREVYGIWESLLEDFRPAWYTGTESPEKKEREVQRFRSRESRLLIMSLRSGAGLDGLQTVCSTAVFGELDYSYGAMEQCIGRFHRDEQAFPVFAYYLTTNDGSDPTIMDLLGVKKGQLEGVRDPGGIGAIAKEIDPDHVKKLAEEYLRRKRRK